MKDLDKSYISALEEVGNVGDAADYLQAHCKIQFAAGVSLALAASSGTTKGKFWTKVQKELTQRRKK